MSLLYSSPVFITVRGPSNDLDSAPSYVLQAFEDRNSDLVTKLKAFDRNAFSNLDLSVESYDPEVQGVHFIFDDVISTYELSDVDREDFLAYVKKILREEIKFGVTSIEVSYASGFERDESKSSVPVRVVVKGPPAETDKALAYIVQALKDRRADIVKKLKSYDPIVFDAVALTIKTIKLPDVEERNSLYLPIEVVVKAKNEKLLDTALPDLLDIAEEYKDELVADLKEYDYDTFKDVEVWPEAKDVADVDSFTEITSHPVHFIFDNVVSSYDLSDDARDEFVRYAKQIMREEMNFGLDLIQVIYASRFELEGSIPSLPVQVTVRGPADETDLALSHVLQAYEDRKSDLAKKLKELDRNTFSNLNLRIESHDLPEVEVPTFVSCSTFALTLFVQV